MRTQLRTAVVVLLASSAAYAWGPEGHGTVADIAESYLSPEARAGIKNLLGRDSMESVCTWPDQIRGQKLAQYAWSFRCHGVVMPRDAKTYDVKRDCPNGCAVSAILEMTHVLRDPKADPATRKDALKFLIHFVGDLHQPLHAGNTDERGMKVEFLGDSIRLHALWDGALIRHSGRNIQQYVKYLKGKIAPADVKAWSGDMDPAHWANESHLAANQYAYVLPTDKKIGEDYYKHNIPVIDRRLSMAGVRLAALLNCAFEVKAGKKTPTTLPCNCPAD